MNIADRIQRLRKAKGIPQEELAEQLGVSRQAVSKWESGQSLPEIDKVLMLSEYFGVSTDYLLKGTEPLAEKHIHEKTNANIFVIVATALNFIGLLVSAAVWYEQQMPMALVIGLAFMAMGCLVYGVGMIGSSAETKPAAKRNFWTINIWILSFIPLAFVYNVLFTHSSAPYPLLGQPYAAFIGFWLVYFCLSLGVVLQMHRTKA